MPLMGMPMLGRVRVDGHAAYRVFHTRRGRVARVVRQMAIVVMIVMGFGMRRVRHDRLQWADPHQTACHRWR